MSIPESITSYLDNNQIAYEAIHHRRDFSAQEAAADTHTKGKDFAKTVILYVDGDYCMAVLPAIYHINMIKLEKALNAKYVSLATEEEIAQVCSDCEVGAMPPLGTIYRMQVYVDQHLAADHMITFNAGTHEEVVRMLYDDFAKLANPKVVDMVGKHW